MMDREKLIKLLANRDGMTIAEVADCILAIIKPSPEPEMWVCKDAKICDVSTKKCEHKTKHKKCESCDYNCCRNNGEGCKCIPYVAEAKKEIMQANHIIVPVGMTEGHSEKHEKNHACGFWGCVPVEQPAPAVKLPEWFESHKINKGDFVKISFNGAQLTLSHNAEVLYVPVEFGDYWILKDVYTGDVHYVSELCTITKLFEKKGV